MAETKNNQERAIRRANVIVPLRIVAIGSAVIALTCLVALVVVTTVTHAETLSTIALTLAIIAFVVQLIVSIVQSGTASQQMMQAQELFGTMQGLLGQIGEQTAGTQAAVNKIGDRLLETALDKALMQARLAGGGDRIDTSAIATDTIRSLPQTNSTTNGGSDGETTDRTEQSWPPAT
jgi:hypothetical protein